MTYYNIHTHQPAANPNEIAIISLDIRKQLLLKTDLYYSAGIHPWFANKNMPELLYEIAKLPSVVAIGEAGLDKLTDTTWELQKNIFLYQTKLAEELQKPLIIHCVKAWQELIAIRKISKPTIPWIIHGFRGKKELASQLIQLGFYVSFGLHYQPEALFEVWNANRLFVETDDKEISIQEIYIAASTTLGVSENRLSEEILYNLQAWPQAPF